MRINHIPSFPAMWKRIFGASSKSPFTSLERRLLEELTQHLSPDACRLFSAQLERINLVRRIGREVCYWPRVRGKVHHAPEIRFPNESTELKLAAIKFRLAHSQDVWKAEFFVVKGHFFSVVFTPRLPRGTRNEDLEIVSMKILHDPMQPFVPVERSKGPAHPEQFPGWLGEWIRSCRAPQVSQPLPLDQQVRLLEGISATLPTDYLELVRQSEGLVLERGSVFGLSEIYEVALDDASYYLLADCGGDGHLGVRTESSDGVLYYLVHEGSGPINAGGSFRIAFEDRCIYNTGKSG